MAATAAEPFRPGGGGFGAFARAKVNLTLHVLARRADGYHELDSLVVFPAIGDYLVAEPAAGLSLSLDGPFGADLDAGGENLVLQAAMLLQDAAGGATPARGAALRLTKRLPVASGIGGGSSDAAAAFEALVRLWKLETLPRETLLSLAARLGADVPVCLAQPAAMVFGGLGEILAPAPALPDFWMVLVNPGEPLPTPEVFRAGPTLGGAGPDLPPERFADLDDLVGWLGIARNDLEAAAVSLRPSIATARAALARQPGCRFARMSGSGATCFGIFETEDAALAAEAALQKAEPAWWCSAGPVAGGGPGQAA